MVMPNGKSYNKCRRCLRDEIYDSDDDDSKNSGCFTLTGRRPNADIAGRRSGPVHVAPRPSEESRIYEILEYTFSNTRILENQRNLHGHQRNLEYCWGRFLRARKGANGVSTDGVTANFMFLLTEGLLSTPVNLLVVIFQKVPGRTFFPNLSKLVNIKYYY